jgi:Caspase domain/Beta xylosidase C-terminal Concanavalin A-like domain
VSIVAGRYALIIANAIYEDSSLAQLRAPSHDAEALRRVLEDENIGGFDVGVVADAGMRDVQLAVVEFFTARRSGDLALLHFSGHGLKDPRGDLYFATRDTELRHLRATGVASAFVNVQISDCAARRVVVILDCCYSGAFAKGALSRADRSVNLAEEFRPAEEERGKGRVVLTAASSTQYAFDGDELSEANDSPSVFTTALVEGLQTGAADLNEDGEISVEDLYEYVYNQVRRRTPYQVPQKHSFAIEGELVIAQSVRPLVFPHDLRANLESASVAARLEAVGELRRWLASPKPARRSAARTELQWRQHNDDSLTVRQQAEAVLAGAAAEDSATGDRPMSKVPPTHRPPEPARITKAQATSRPPPAVPSEEELPPTAAHDGVGAGTGITQDRSIGAPAPPLRRNGTRTDRRRRIALVTAAVIALGAVTGSALWFSVLQDRSPGRASPAPSSTAPSSTAPGCGAINDEFNTASLAPGWEQLNGGRFGRFGLSDGAMAITASDGADVRSDLQGAVTAPFLARTLRGDFRIETTVTVDPQYSYQGAGLLLYRDTENYVRLERGFGSQGAIAFEYAADGRHTKLHGPFSGDADPIKTSATVVGLRLVRTGKSIKGFWRQAGATTWQELSGTPSLAGRVKTGVAVLNRSQPPAGDPSRKPLTATFAYVNVAC